ncbi:MAG: hypothetical protein ACR2LL_08030 [Nitrosopumilus sp.]
MFDRPELSLSVILPLYGFWIAMLFLDMRITLSLKDLIKRYEENETFRFLYTKYKRSIVGVLQLIIEAIFVLVLPSLVFPREFGVTLFWDYNSSTIFAAIVGVFHGIAWYNNRKNVKEILENKKFS